MLAEKILVHFEVNEPFSIGDVPFFLLLGVITGLVSLYFNRANQVITNLMEGIQNTWVKGKYVGFVSRANVFNAYRQTLIDVSHE